MSLVTFELATNAPDRLVIGVRPATGLAVVGDRLIVAGLGPWDSDVGAPASPRQLHLVDPVSRSTLSVLPVVTPERSIALRGPPLLANSGPGDATMVVAWRYGAELVEVDLQGAPIRGARLPESLGFRDLSSDLGVDPTARPEDLVPTLVHVTASADAVLVGYFQSQRGDSRLRYLVYDRRTLSRKAVELAPGPFLATAARADTLLAVTNAGDPTGDRPGQSLTLNFLVACSG